MQDAGIPLRNEPILAPTDAKRQHYVPEMFLDSFTGPDGNVRVFDLETQTEFRTSPTNVAVQGYFNDVEIDGEILSTEKWLSQVEGKANPILKGLTSDPDNIEHLSMEEEMPLARFLATLRFRTPQYRDWHDGMMATVASQIKELIRDQLFYRYGEKEGQAKWEVYEDQPDYRWLGRSERPQLAEPSTFMLEKVQGWANLLRAAP
jgi:hypothetical protein